MHRPVRRSGRRRSGLPFGPRRRHKAIQPKAGCKDSGKTHRPAHEAMIRSRQDVTVVRRLRTRVARMAPVAMRPRLAAGSGTGTNVNTTLFDTSTISDAALNAVKSGEMTS